MNKTTEALKLAEQDKCACDSPAWCTKYKKCNREMLGLPKAEPVQEPVYAFRRIGLNAFCTCTKERYEELADMPYLFEVTTFYAAPVDAKALLETERKHHAFELSMQEELFADKAEAIRAEALEEVVKFLSESGLITPTGRFAAATRARRE